MKSKSRSYSELIFIDNYEDRFKYLKLDGVVGDFTFGCDRYLNQQFYRSNEWKQIRNKVIVRDNGNDLGMEGYPIDGSIYIHHINPISRDDVINHSCKLFDMNNLICVSYDTHQALHYGDDSILRSKIIVERHANDTCPWKNK